MSDDTGSPHYTFLHSWLTNVRQAASDAHQAGSPQIVNRIERDVLAMRAREAAHYLTALADRLELFDA